MNNYDDIDAVRSSLLKNFYKYSPKKAKYLMDTPPTPTADQIFGQAFHSLFLEPLSFDESFYVCQSFDRRTNAGKALAEQQEKRALGKTLVPEKDFKTMQEMSLQLHADMPELKTFLDVGQIERIFTATIHGVSAKARPDVVIFSEQSDGEKVFDLIDLKTARFADPNYARVINLDNIDLQLAFYAAVISASTNAKLRHAYIVAVEKTEPFDSILVKVGEQDLELGRVKFEYAISTYTTCLNNNCWPSWSPITTEGESGWKNTQMLELSEKYSL